ncbi:MAG: hypothetical protein Tsb0020_12650 [Haliangiales bacterium]
MPHSKLDKKANVRYPLVLAIALCAAGLYLAPAAVWAQSEASDPDAVERARQHYDKASALQADGNYQRAAEEYLKAYALYPEPEFYYNVAQVYRLDGDHKQALHYYREYLRLDPNGRGADSARQYIQELTHELAVTDSATETAAQGAAEGATESTSEGQPPSDGGETPDPTAPAPASTTGPEEPAPMPAQPEGESGVTVSEGPRDAGSSNRSLLIAGLASIGVGAISAGLGVKYAVDVNDHNSTVEDASEWNERTLDAFERGESAERNMWIAAGVAAAAVAAGVTLIVLSGDEAPAERPAGLTLGPVLAPHTAGVSISGRL